MSPASEELPRGADGGRPQQVAAGGEAPVPSNRRSASARAARSALKLALMSSPGSEPPFERP
jgi:hypothetical protein